MNWWVNWYLKKSCGLGTIRSFSTFHLLRGSGFLNVPSALSERWSKLRGHFKERSTTWNRKELKKQFYKKNTFLIASNIAIRRVQQLSHTTTLTRLTHLSLSHFSLVSISARGPGQSLTWNCATYLASTPVRIWILDSAWYLGGPTGNRDIKSPLH